VTDGDGHLRVVGPKGGGEAGEVDAVHGLGLHRAEHDGAAQPATDLIDGLAGGLRGGQRSAGFREQRATASDSWTRWVERSKRVTPSSRSSVRTPAETADWTRCRRSEARVKLPSSATATNVLR
jgi:hypothetical protein